jgi:hypothetical protein
MTKAPFRMQDFYQYLCFSVKNKLIPMKFLNNTYERFKEL